MPINTSTLTDTIASTALNMKHLSQQEAIKAEQVKSNAIATEGQRIASNQEIVGLKEQVENARVAVAGIESKEAQEALEFGTDKEGNQITLETKKNAATEEIKSIADKIAEHDAKNGPTESQTGAVKGQRTRLVNRLKKAQTAFDDLQNEINARTTVRNNFNILKYKLEGKLKTHQEKFGGKK